MSKPLRGPNDKGPRPLLIPVGIEQDTKPTPEPEPTPAPLEEAEPTEVIEDE
jgi:hypothetical protein